MTQSKNVKTWQGGKSGMVSDGISLTRFNHCPEQMSAANLYYVQYEWANTMGKLIAPERLAMYCGFYAYPHRNGPSPVLNMDAQHTARHRGWCGGASNVFLGQLDMVEYLCTYTKWCTQYYVWSPTNTCETSTRKFEHVWKYIHGTLVHKFQF